MASSDTFLNNLVDTLNSTLQQDTRFYGWVLNRTESQSFQRLYSLTDPDEHKLDCVQERETEERTYSIRAYTRQGHPVHMGTIASTIDPFSPLEQQIRSAFENALLSENEPWDLPGSPEEPFASVETADPEILSDPMHALTWLSGQMQDHIPRLDGVQVNSAEIYINLKAKYTLYSTGLELERMDSDAYFEAAMEKAPGPNTQEVHHYKKGVTVSEMDIPGFLDKMREETITLDDTVLPPTSQNTAILVDAEVNAAFLNAITDQLSAEAEYNRSPHIKPEDSVVESTEGIQSDSLQLEVDPFLPLMVASSAWSPEGLPAKKVTLVQDNIARNQIIGNRMGQYLSRQPNGATGNFVLLPGHHSRAELLESQEECLEILAFSSLLINARTLTWSSEIKLAKLHRRGQSPVMIKGGVASGEIKKNLGSALYSSEMIAYNQVGDSWHPSIGYRGPEYVLIQSGVKIAGND